ncbi:LRP12-like protein [Mya arenaria]|uniref:LRP12-like protein n=1 Tax=Mya arenaria TaxID=6604 RepID=A0ABY7ERA2_MYAAR|nr:LRP12-like protein [Mya arenaria]
MDQYCGSTIDMIMEGIDDGKLVIDGYVNQRDCNVTIETWYTADRLHFQFEDFDMGSGICDDTYFTVYDGLDRVCGSGGVEGDFTSSGRYLTFRFKNGGDFSYNQMTLVFTAYHTGYCYSYEYSCDNGRCISEDSNCNGYDPCGDQSDCRLGVGEITGPRH